MKRLLVVLVVLGLLAAGTAAWISSNSNGAEKDFSFDEMKYGPISEVVNATGIVKPREVALVFCRVPGTVEEIYGIVGQKVEKGQPLFKVGSQMHQLSLDRAQAALNKAKALRNSAKSGLDYMNKIKDSSSVSITKERELEVQTKYDAAVEGVKEAETALKQAQLAIDWATVTSPISGTIIEKNLYIGQPVGLSAAVGGSGGSGAGASMPSIPGGSSSTPTVSSAFGMNEAKIPFIIAADLGDLEVYAQIPQGDIGKVRAGLPAQFTVDAFPDERPFEGQVKEVHLMPMNVLGTNFYPAVIKVGNRKAVPNDPNAPKSAESNWVLRPGMTVNVDITRETHNNVWMLPSAALSFTLDDYYIKPEAKQSLAEKMKKVNNPSDWKTVWILSGNKAWPILAKIGGKNDQGRSGINSGNYVEVLKWDEEMTKMIDGDKTVKPEDPKTYPKPIIAAPQPKQSILDRPILKFS